MIFFVIGPLHLHRHDDATFQQSSCQGGKSIVFSFFYPDAHNFSVPYCGPFCASVGLFGYVHTPWTRSTKPFTKRLCSGRGVSSPIFDFVPLCSPTAQHLTVDRFAWAWARSDTSTLPEHAPQNRLWNDWVLVEVRHFPFSCFYCYAHQCLSTYCGSFRVIVGLFGYLHTPWTRSTNLLTKRMSSRGGKSLFIFVFLPLCSPSAQYLNLVHSVWSWARSDTYTLPEHAPQNCSRNGYVLVEVCQVQFLTLCPCSPTAQHLTVDHFAWARSDTWTLSEHAPKKHLWNG